MLNKLPKTAVGYMMKSGTQYTCSDCAAYDPDSRRCLFLGADDVVLPMDGCNLFMKGEVESIVPAEGKGRDTDGDSAMGLVTLQEVGFVSSNFGFSCKRCENFLEGFSECKVVDADSDGDTQGIIAADACCNGWCPCPDKVNMPTEAFD